MATDHLDPESLAFDDLPPFPNDVPTAPLLRISLKKLIDQDTDEQQRLWRACCDLGFFYLDLRAGSENGDGELNGDGLLADAEAMFTLGKQVLELPEVEKVQYDYHDAGEQGSYFGYRRLGQKLIDGGDGKRDGSEFWNSSKDDLLGVTDPLPAPAVLQKEGNRALVRRYVQRSHAVVTLLLGVLSDQLGLPAHTLQNLHRLRTTSCDIVRWVRAPWQPMDENKISLGQHTDFGSVSVLFNRLGGLQVLPPGEGAEWSYVRPLQGHCICNLGDAMVKFSAGILRSNLHRVVNPPGKQEGLTRMSLVYFARPEDEVLLRALEGSEMIDARRGQQDGGADEEEVVTAKDWIYRRSIGRRVGVNHAKSMGTDQEGLKQSSKVISVAK
ncbi:hypothetical protein BAUCODRAFT_74629 [Baudoinia panamericana UAMH 10762]|uniref:Fe2OG dioxygenase domain-containing protein n=1 Tax=Baudoinia panamericana (strain UAMH 10762) TaxID=717646 RepID=M2MRT7_BAUPA|nr:uncharacterized protein BAUCODRAFT_74629 [Baudoinia panamericana UAMH 10762]EMC94208.1 hypothetical protein BAUCODRAFT_74629 [Baudoinia panamericana UAMH 10762]